MAIARTAAEAVVGDHLWLMGGVNDGRSRPAPPILVPVTKVARVYLTIEGRDWAFGPQEFNRETGWDKPRRDFLSDRRVLGYEGRRQGYYIGLVREMIDHLKEMYHPAEYTEARVRQIEEIAFAMGLPPAPDYSTMPEEKA